MCNATGSALACRGYLAALGMGLLLLVSAPAETAVITQFHDFSLSTEGDAFGGGEVEEEDPFFTRFLEHVAQFSQLDPTQGTLSSVSLSLTGQLTPTLQEETDPITFSTSTETSLSALSQTASSTNTFDVDAPTSFASTDFAINETLNFTGADLADFIGTGTIDAFVIAELIGTIDNVADCQNGLFTVCEPEADLAYSGQLALEYEYLPADPANVSFSQFHDFSLSTEGDAFGGGEVEEEDPFTLLLNHVTQFSQLDPTQGTLSSVSLSLTGQLTPTLQEEDDPITFSTSTETSLSALSQTASSTNSFDVAVPTLFASTDFAINETLNFTAADLADFIGTGTIDAFVMADFIGTIDNLADCQDGLFTVCEPAADLAFSGRVSLDYNFAATPDPVSVPEPGTLLLLVSALAPLLWMRRRWTNSCPDRPTLALNSTALSD